MAEVGYFVEDHAHLSLIRPLVQRVFREQGSGVPVAHHERSTTGGSGRALAELRRFFRDLERDRAMHFDVLVVALDGNCRGYSERKRQILDVASRVGYGGSIVCAVPDPHVERWFLLDAKALREALGGGPLDWPLPAYKCDRDWYKGKLAEACGSAGVYPVLGGIEYGEEIARLLDLYAAGERDASFRHFCSDLVAAVRRLRVAQP